MGNLKSGLFINLYDEDTLQLYLNNNIYGFLMPYNKRIMPQSRHFNALADYACAREGTHVFFFLKRKIVYGGRIIGNRKIGSFYLNGNKSPLGELNDAKLAWDESFRYVPSDKNGVFLVKNNNGELQEKYQPYLILFEDDKELHKGTSIVSDKLYFELGNYGYPMPSNSISGMGFCTLTPGETDIALRLLKESNENILDSNYKEKDKKYLIGEPIKFDGNCGFDKLSKAYKDKLLINEAHIEASILANPNLLPSEVQPNENDVLCRQVPISPFKPENMDRADICIYEKDSILNGTIPNHIIELKKNKANKKVIEQVQRYLKWIQLVLRDNPKLFEKVRVSILAPDYTKNVKEAISKEYESKITLYTFDGEKY